jgi:hypothetical protein
MPNNAAYPLTHAGAFDQSAGLDVMSCMQQDAIFVVTPVVTNVNPTTATTMMSGTIKANTLGAINKGFEAFACGTYSCGASSTLVFTIVLGGVTVATFTTASQTNTATTLNWQIQLFGGVITTGSAGTLEVHGELNFDSGSALSAACSTFLDSVTAASSAINLTIDSTFAVQSNFGSSNGSNTITQRMLEVVICN